MKASILALALCTCVASTPVFADEPPAVYLVDAGVGSDVATDAGSGSGSGSAVVTLPPIDTMAGLKARYDELRASYNALKDSDGSPRKLALAALMALVLKFLLDAANRVAEDRWKKQLAWAALGLAVPIALLSKYAGGVGWFDALVYAGAGPGAIVVHELLARFRKPS